MKLFGFMPIREALFLVFLGGLICVGMGAVYYTLEWAWQDYDDHDRGLFEGMLLLVTGELGNRVARHIANRKERRRSKTDENDEVKP